MSRNNKNPEALLPTELQCEMREAIGEFLNEVDEKGERFPVDFDALQRWAGYSRKGNAKRALTTSTLTLDVDFAYLRREAKEELETRGGHNKQIIKLSLDGAKQFLMLANTEQGKQVRLYFIECERKWRLLKKNVDRGRIAMVDKVTVEPNSIFT